MSDHTSSDAAAQVLAMVQSSEVLRSLVEKHADLRELLIQAADAAAESSELQRLFEAVALAAAASDRELEARWSGNDNSAELAKLELLASQAHENLGTVLREFCPDAPATIGDDVSAPAAN
jgi:hypothetical protein